MDSDQSASDDVLVGRASGGDSSAFRVIVDRYHMDMLRLAFVICQDQTAADDAVQAAWRRAWSGLRRIREASSLKAWLLRIAGNEARRLARRQSNRREIPLHADLGVEAFADHAVQTLDEALGELDPLDRQVLALRYLAGYTATELAPLLGVTPEGVRTRLHRARRRLAEHLSDE